MEFKSEKKKGPWHLAKEKVQSSVMEKAKSMGYNHLTPSLISPKSIRDNPNHVLLMGYEFAGKHMFILFDKDWNDLVDKDNNPTTELVLYTLPMCKNYDEVYSSVGFHEEGPYVVNINELQPVVARPGFAKEPQLDFEFSDSYLSKEEQQDEHTSTMTIRDLLSIIQCVPVSTKSWLNEEIKKINVIRNKN